MSGHPSIERELRLLMLAIDAGEASDDEHRKLNQLLVDHPELAIEAASLLDQQAALADAKRSLPRKPNEEQYPRVLNRVRTEVDQKVETDARRVKSKLWRFMPAIAASLLLTHLGAAGLAWLAADRNDANRDAVVAVQNGSAAAIERGREQFTVVPQLVSMTGCVWDPSDSVQPLVGQSLNRGEVLHLHEGIAVFELGQPSGDRARIRMEGPAKAIVRADGLLGFTFGMMTADVTWRNRSFVIDTSVGKVVVPDNASIGVLSRGGRSEVHVFRGRVEVSSAWSYDEQPMMVLEEGEALAMSGSQSGEPSIVRFQAAPERFASSRSMMSDQIVFGEDYRDAIRAAKPALYWRFEQGTDRAQNEGELSGLNLYPVGGVSWNEAADNRSVEFGVSSIPGMLVSRGAWPREPLDNYTIEVWAKPSHYHKGTLVSLVGELLPTGQSPHSFLIELGGPYELSTSPMPSNGVRFLHRTPLSINPLDGTSCHTDSPYTPRKWLQFVARKNGSQLNLLIDGELVASGENDTPLPAGTNVLIGQLYPWLGELGPNAAHRPFVGQIDEVSIYERALSDDEIRRHHELARPSVPPGDSI